jgi:hypothetical protein
LNDKPLIQIFKTIKKYNPLNLIVLQVSNSYNLAIALSKLHIHTLGIEGVINDDSTIESSDVFYDSLLKHNFDLKRAAEYASCMTTGTDAIIHLYYNGNKVNS